MRIKLLLFLLLFTAIAEAQEVKTSLRMALEDNSAKTYRVLDENDEPCALVKVKINRPINLTFESEFIIGDPEKKSEEYWVYLLEGTEFITIKNSNIHPIDVKFPVPLERECTYYLTIELPLSMSIDEAKQMVRGGEKLEFSTISVTQNAGKISRCEITVQLPKGNTIIDDRIREFVMEYFEQELDFLSEGHAMSFYQGDMDDYKARLTFYAKEIAKTYVPWAQDMYNRNRELYDKKGYCYISSDSIFVADEYDDFITLQVERLLNCGGFEVYPERSFYSFRKSDGRTFGIEMIQKDKLEEFYSAVIKKVMNSLDEDSIDEIMMMSDTYDNYSTQEAIQYFRSQINEYGLQMYIQKNAISVVFTWCGAACDAISHVVTFTKGEMQKYLKRTLQVVRRT